jgi:hypothetical protein
LDRQLSPRDSDRLIYDKAADNGPLRTQPTE